MKLYHSPKTRSARIVWLLEELGDVPCEIVERKFTRVAGRLYGQDTPMGKFPTLDDDGAVFFQYGAILEYILERYGRGRLRPASTSADLGPYLQWVHFAEATLGIPLAAIRLLKTQTGDYDAAFEILSGRVNASIAKLETALSGKIWLVGDSLSGADIMCGYAVKVAQAIETDTAAFPSVEAWTKRIGERQAWQIAMAGDPPY